MNNFYSYVVDLGSDNSNVLIVYIAGKGFSRAEFNDYVRGEFLSFPFITKLVIISAEYNRIELKSELLDSKKISVLKNNLNGLQQLSVYAIYYQKDGQYKFDEVLEKENEDGFSIKEHKKKIIELGLLNIVKKRSLIMEASENYHFIKPSGKHTNRFIKVSNLMEYGAEISFLAINLLKFAKGEIDKIYVDTSGILAIAYKLVSIKRRFNNECCDCFVDSFGSYEGLTDYKFNGTKESLVLVSASTSQDMIKELKNTDGLEQTKIVTLFSNKVTNVINCLFDLDYFHLNYNDDYFRGFNSDTEENCELCKYEKSIPLSLSNKQFIFESPDKVFYLPMAIDSSSSLKQMMSSYKDSGAFKCLYDGLQGKSAPVPEYFIDVSTLVKNNLDYKNKVELSIRRNFPLYADLIVHCNDSGAKDLALFINNELKSISNEKRLVSLEDLDDESPKQGIVVIAGSCETGKALLNVSRKLRQYVNLPITYIVGFSKYNDPASYDKLKKDLTYSSGDLGNHTFFAINEIMLPIKEFRMNSWDREIEILSTYSVNAEPEFAEAVQNRISHLKTSSSTAEQGIGADIFLPSISNNNLVLGPTFAFWDKSDTKESHTYQASVYYTISSILQSLRYNKKKNGAVPLGDGFLLRQLDPLMFDRFNEGIIQASVLRGAKARELDYSADDHRSQIVGTLIERMVKDPKSTGAEALPEFLLALCTEKLQIKKDHITFLKEAKIPKEPNPIPYILHQIAIKVLFDIGEKPQPNF